MFHGDYTGLAVDSLDRVHVVWTGLNDKQGGGGGGGGGRGGGGGGGGGRGRAALIWDKSRRWDRTRGRLFTRQVLYH